MARAILSLVPTLSVPENEHRLMVARQLKQPAESTDSAQHLGPCVVAASALIRCLAASAASKSTPASL